MRKLGVLLLLVMSFVAAPAYPADLLELEGMVGVPSPAFAIAGIPGGGFPWVINRGDRVLDDEGLLKVKVRGLLIDPAVGPPKTVCQPRQPGKISPTASAHPLGGAPISQDYIR